MNEYPLSPRVKEPGELRRYEVVFTAPFKYVVPAWSPEQAKQIATHWWFRMKRPEGVDIPTSIEVTEVVEKRTWFRKESGVGRENKESK